MGALEDRMQRRGNRRSSVIREMQASLNAIERSIRAVNWAKVFQSSFMLLFVAYPGVALNVMRMFHCVSIDGRSYLAADMRLECYTSAWTGSVLE